MFILNQNYHPKNTTRDIRLQIYFRSEKIGKKKCISGYEENDSFAIKISTIKNEFHKHFKGLLEDPLHIKFII